MPTAATPEDRPTAVRGQPRLKAYVRESRGVHRLADLGDGLPGGLHAWQLLMTSSGCFTGLTSAAVRQWWLPPLPVAIPVFMAMGLDDPRPMRRGVLTSRHTREIGFDEIGGLRCASTPETLLACARWLSVIDTVVLIDGVLHTGEASREEIEEVIRPRRPGARRLQEALAIADGRSESPFETLLRLLHMSCDVDVVPQYQVVDADGVVVAIIDLWLCGTRAAHEFDGDEHEEAPRRVKDRRRDRKLDKAGYVRRGYTAGDVLHRPVTVLEDADRALGRPHDPSRIRPWTAQLRESLFTPAGQAAFLRRVGVQGGG
jgi:very-short-patch-repair endonuclease